MRSPSPLLSLSLTATTLLSLLPPTTAQTTRTITVPASHPTSEPEWNSDDTFQSAVLDSHNEYRSEHNADDLVWNSTLADYAEEYLDSEGDDDDECPAFEHSDTPYGENLAIGFPNATASVEAWGDERDMYDFDDQGFDSETGHFTQMVWQDTTDVGCARKLCRGDDRDIEGWYLVCEYWPVGNVRDQYDDQVSEGDYDGPEDDSGAPGGVGRRPESLPALVLAIAGGLFLAW